MIDGRLITTQDPFDLYQNLLRSRTRSQLMKTLNGLGVETSISSLGRVEETVVFVLGAHYPDESVSQLAVDKETFLPVRLLLTDGKTEASDQRLEMYYRNWQKNSGRLVSPHKWPLPSMAIWQGKCGWWKCTPIHPFRRK